MTRHCARRSCVRVEDGPSETWKRSLPDTNLHYYYNCCYTIFVPRTTSPPTSPFYVLLTRTCKLTPIDFTFRSIIIIVIIIITVRVAWRRLRPFDYVRLKMITFDCIKRGGCCYYNYYFVFQLKHRRDGLSRNVTWRVGVADPPGNGWAAGGGGINWKFVNGKLQVQVVYLCCTWWK